MSVARVPDSRRLQSIFAIVEYIRLSNTSHFPPLPFPPNHFPPMIYLPLVISPPLLFPPITTSPPPTGICLYI